MEVAQLTLEYVKALIWPVVLFVGFVGFVFFRKEIRIAAKSLYKIKLPGGTELEWQNQIRAVEEAADKVEATPKPIDVSKTEAHISSFIKNISKYNLLASPIRL